MLKSSPATDLKAEFDVAWVYAGGANPADYLRKYKGRNPAHPRQGPQADKERRQRSVHAAGPGVQNWKEIITAAHESGVEWFAYEQDSGQGSPWTGLARASIS